MLSVQTLWIIFVINFVSLGLVWAYVIRIYPAFGAARYWAAASTLAAVGAFISGLRGFVTPVVPILVGNPLLIFACCLGAMGVRRFYDRSPMWGLHIGIVAIGTAGLALFTWHDDMPARITVTSLAQASALLLALPLMFSRIDRGRRAGAQLTACIAAVMIAVYFVRVAGAMLNISGEISFTTFNPFQAAMVLSLVFLSTAWNFGFLLMGIDKLHGEIADLALLDDLTGVANRRHLQQRLATECAVAQATGEAFTVLAIDLDGFKGINDRYGHAAGDECLRLFTRTAQDCLRANDVLARVGGDEFCVVLPASTQREGAMIARHIVEACRAQKLRNDDRMIGVSIGVAQWHAAIGDNPERLIAAADDALYAAKSQGKNRHMIFDHAPPDLQPPLMRQSA